MHLANIVHGLRQNAQLKLVCDINNSVSFFLCINSDNGLIQLIVRHVITASVSTKKKVLLSFLKYFGGFHNLI